MIFKAFKRVNYMFIYSTNATIHPAQFKEHRGKGEEEGGEKGKYLFLSL